MTGPVPGATGGLRLGTTDGLRLGATTTLPLPAGTFRATAFDTGPSTPEHLVLVFGSLDATDLGDAPLVRVHSECLTGDIFGSQRCDCGEQLQRSLALVAAEPAGAVVYLRGHEGRGIGLGAKLAAYRLQDSGLDTIQANLALGLPVDARDYGAAAAVLRRLGVTVVRLLTNNPGKVAALERHGVRCSSSVPMPATVTVANAHYLRTKAEMLGHEGLTVAAVPRDPSKPGDPSDPSDPSEDGNLWLAG